MAKKVVKSVWQKGCQSMAGKSVSIDELRAMMTKEEFGYFWDYALNLLDERGDCKKFQMRFLPYERFMDLYYRAGEGENLSFNYYWNEALYYALNLDKERMEKILNKWRGKRVMINCNKSQKRIPNVYVAICNDFRDGYNASQITKKYAITPEYARQIKRRYKDRV